MRGKKKKKERKKEERKLILNKNVMKVVDVIK